MPETSSNREAVRVHHQRLVIVISGRVASGKTTLAEGLGQRLHANVVRTRPILDNQYFVDPALSARAHLQRLGETLDAKTGGRWVAEATARAIRNTSPLRLVIVDAVRRDTQIDHLRSLLQARVLHIHTTAPDEVLERRYEKRRSEDAEGELPSYAAVRENDTEAAVPKLGQIADARFNTGRWPAAAVLFRARWLVARRRLGAAALTGISYVTVGLLGLLVIVGAAVLIPVVVVGLLGAALVGFLVSIACFVITMAALVGWALSPRSPVGPRRSQRS
jgi:predicted kinase